MLRGLTGLALLLVIIVAVRMLRREDGGSTGEAEPYHPRPLTSYPGNEVTPALSPDGRLIAFAWGGEVDDNYDIYVLQIGDASPLRLTEDPAVDIHPVWSPDGMQLAYIHDEGPGAEIRVVPVLGGPSRRLIHLPHGLGGGFSWAPDRASIVYATRPSMDRSTRLHLLDLETGEERALTDEAPRGSDDVEPKFSPDGLEIAFIRRHASGFQELWTVPSAGGGTRCVRPGLLYVMGYDWARHGRELLCSALLDGSFSLWRVDVADGGAACSSVLGEWIHTPSVARGSDRLAYHHYRHERNIWRLELGAESSSGPEPVVVSTHWDAEPSISPDGQYLAFTSTRSGTLELWVSEADGSHPRQVTGSGGGLVLRPRWSPEGRRIAFSANRDGVLELHVVEVDGGRPQRLHSGTGNAYLSDWSRDGQWIYFASERDGQWNLWRLATEGPPDAGLEQVTHGGAVRGHECADGYFYYSRPHFAGLWRLPLDRVGEHGPSEAENPPWLADRPPTGHWDRWAVCRDQIVLLSGDDQNPTIVIHDPASGNRRALAELPGLDSPSIAFDQDGTTWYFVRIEKEMGDLMLVEGFR
jgi:Tol biopolymer transport system component